MIDCSDFKAYKAGAGPLEPGPNGLRRPGAADMDRATFGGHHHTHGVKYEESILACGMTMSFIGPYASRRQDRFVTEHSEFSNKFKYAQEQDLALGGNLYFAFGDNIYVNSEVVKRSHRLPNAEENTENCILRKLRVCVENDFAYLKHNLFPSVGKNKLNILNDVHCMVPLVACLLKNASIALTRGGQVSATHSHSIPPTLEVYFGVAQE